MKDYHSNYLLEKLDQIEMRLQALIEGISFQATKRSKFQQSLAHELVGTMKMHLTTWPDGKISAPYQYVIHINPSHGKTWIPEQYLLDELAEVIRQAGQDTGLVFSNSPDIRLVADYDLPIDDFRIEIPSSSQIDQTSTLTVTPPELRSQEPPHNEGLDAFLIVNSKDNIHLKQAVINLGRNADNHVIIEDGRVSRVHAQLRCVKGRYILFDLNSKGGTFVNGKKVVQSILNSGDVISLAGVPIIFVQEMPSTLGHTKMMSIQPPQDPEDDRPSKPDQPPGKK